MHAGHYISGAGHLGLIAWLMLGGLFAAQPDPIEITEVSVISGADFAALMAAQDPPQTADDVAQPDVPAPSVSEPDVQSAPDIPVVQETPETVDVPEVETPPDIPEPAPETAEAPQDLTDPVGDIAVLTPDVAPEAAPRPIERVAPEPVAQPQPEASPDVAEQEAVTPDEQTNDAETEQQEATAPQEAVSEIVTEATQAPAQSIRPPGRRPAAPSPQVTEAPQAEDSSEDTVNNDDVLAALAAAQEATRPASGPPLSSSEREALRVAVAQCWNVGSLSSEAMQTTVVVSVRMNQDATPVTESIRMLSASGGSDAAARRVYDSARRAIILCGARGLSLPADKFDQWRTIEMTFDPRKMALR